MKHYVVKTGKFYPRILTEVLFPFIIKINTQVGP